MFGRRFELVTSRQLALLERRLYHVLLSRSYQSLLREPWSRYRVRQRRQLGRTFLSWQLMKVPRLALQPIGRSIWFQILQSMCIDQPCSLQQGTQHRYLTMWWFGWHCIDQRGRQCLIFGLWCMDHKWSIWFCQSCRSLYLQYRYQSGSSSWHIWFCCSLEHYHCSMWSSYRLLERYQEDQCMSSSILNCQLRPSSCLDIWYTQFYPCWILRIHRKLGHHWHWWLVLAWRYSSLSLDLG